MTIAERFQNVNIFEKMNTFKTLPTNDMISVEALNKLWLVRSGFKVMGGICNLSDDDIATILSSLYHDKWTALLSNLSDVGTGYRETYSENTTGNNVVNETSNTVSSNNVSADNSETYSPKDQNTDDVTANNTRDTTGSKEYTKTIKKNSDLTAKQTVVNFLQKNNICNIMFTDIEKELCLSIYE